MLKKLTFISLGGMFIAIGINVFILPLHLINGGVIGISLLLNYTWGFNLGLTI
ncbi:YitT family protein [Terrilactibacillus sp. S3-3]|nr:YitT family protein [Terrilactibacillus sp. S3-3]